MKLGFETPQFLQFFDNQFFFAARHGVSLSKSMAKDIHIALQPNRDASFERLEKLIPIWNRVFLIGTQSEFNLGIESSFLAPTAQRMQMLLSRLKIVRQSPLIGMGPASTL
jgi:hypothetical protein